MAQLTINSSLIAKSWIQSEGKTCFFKFLVANALWILSIPMSWIWIRSIAKRISNKEVDVMMLCKRKPSLVSDLIYAKSIKLI